MADIHGRVEPIFEMKENSTAEVGGFSRIATAIHSIRDQYPHDVLVIASGDYLTEDFRIGQYCKKFKGEAIFSLMNRYHIDVATLGNHNFSFFKVCQKLKKI